MTSRDDSSSAPGTSQDPAADTSTNTDITFDELGNDTANNTVTGASPQATPANTPAATGVMPAAKPAIPKTDKKNARNLTNVVWKNLTRNEILETVIAQYFRDPTSRTSAPREIEAILINNTNIAFAERNQSVSIKDKGIYTPITELTPKQTANILLHRHHVVSIQPSGKNSDPDYDLLAIYQESGPDEGIYATSTKIIRKHMRAYNSSLTKKGADEIFAILEETAPRRPKCTEEDIIPVDNGIYNYKTKLLTAFDPAVILTSKARVTLNVNQRGEIIPPQKPSFLTPDGDYWDIDSWMNELSDDPEIVHLLWEIIGAVLRPHVRWSKSAWFYSEKGNNGKGTLVHLMRCILGESSYVSLPLSEMGKDFALEGLTRASAILTDENDVGTYIDKAANLKSIITNDVIAINRKHRSAINYQFWGFMVQCLNERPRTKDRSESIYRRQLFVPFEKSFTGIERKYIKNLYMQDITVLQYVVWKVLVEMDPYYELSEPAASKRALEEYKAYNDPVRAFWGEFEEQFVWDLLPDGFLYELYKAWYTKTNPGGAIMNMRNFSDQLWTVVENSEIFDGTAERRKEYRPGKKFANVELLIHEYQLEDWCNHTYSGPDPEKYSAYTPPPTKKFRGIARSTAIPAHAVIAGIRPAAPEDNALDEN